MTQPKRVALITGGGSGIGAATALQFAYQDTAVAIVGRRQSILDDIAQVIRLNGGQALPISADLADATQPRRIIQTVIERWGRLDVVINNAATIQNVPIEQATLSLFDEHIAVNVRAPYLLIQAALPYLTQSNAPSIVNISSSSGSLAIPNQSMYGMSKAALEFLTRSLAAEFAWRGIRVNGIAPGPVDTPIHLVWAGDDVAGAYERMTRELPLGRMGNADEVASWIVWLCQPQASWVTGVVIAVDGGQTLPGAMSFISNKELIKKTQTHSGENQ
jgi:NAD(P)-dependent dehydrogenase (short-subunit alcohol dehydrogenase family)